MTYTDYCKSYSGIIYEDCKFYSGKLYEVHLWDVKQQKNILVNIHYTSQGWQDWIRQNPECSYENFKV